jgi:microcystin-dependent protein
MSDQFVAEIRIFACNFAPVGWAQCNGQVLPISQNTALFSLLGTFYGGDGRSTFALPNLQGNAPMHQFQGAGLTEHFLGEEGGLPSVTLLQTEMPAHTHALNGSNGPANLQSPAGDRVLGRATNSSYLDTTTSPPLNLVPMSPQAVSVTGSGLPHNNMQPYLTVNFCIALQGIFPARN